MDKNTKRILVVDDDPSTLKKVVNTIVDTGTPYVVVSSNDEGWQTLESGAGITHVIVRCTSANIDATDLCVRIRESYTHEEMCVIVMLRDEELTRGAEMLIAGASDLLVGDFEPRELRMRAGIVPTDQIDRIDKAHTRNAESGGTLAGPQFHIPEFDEATRRYTFGHNEACIAEWEADPDVRKVPLDKMIVCPECCAVPTFRAGCGCCGGAFAEPETLIHHYACAHVAPEAEFHSKSGLSCPKCRLNKLVAGSDFEQMPGHLRCVDCRAMLTELCMIGHCLACEHRFAMADGLEMVMYGYQIGKSPDSAIISAPTFHTSRRAARAEYETWQADTVGSYSI